MGLQLAWKALAARGVRPSFTGWRPASSGIGIKSACVDLDVLGMKPNFVGRLLNFLRRIECPENADFLGPEKEPTSPLAAWAAVDAQRDCVGIWFKH
jgi:hypothetical protein